MHVETKSELVVDRSRHGELLRINFNMSFPQLSCEFATVDVSDALGTVGRRASLMAPLPVTPPLSELLVLGCQKLFCSSEQCVSLQKRLNLTKTVRKLPIDENFERKGYYTHDDHPTDIKYDSEEHQAGWQYCFHRLCDKAAAAYECPL